MDHEYRVLLAAYGRAQRLCSERLVAQRAEIERLEGALMRARARTVIRDTQLAWANQDREALEAQIPGLPRRRMLARHVEQLVLRVQSLMRELRLWRAGIAPHALRKPVQALDGAQADAEFAVPAVLCLEQGEGGQLLASHIASTGESATSIGDAGDDPALLEASLVAADLVICQTGCVSHDAYWRVQDHCRRTGKACVLVEQPQALQWVRMVRRVPVTADASSGAEPI